ncbi:NfeD family protein [Halobacillus naozhouensis]|uniref:NfeD family protein n=1 Tax=Halobacillus naozhouensis TaxID=554880 RepID=UPI0031FD4DFC
MKQVDLLSYNWIVFLITLFGTMFLVGELLVNMRGLLGLMGLGFITIYFSSYLTFEMFVMMMVVYLFGLVLIIIDGKVVNDGTLATIGGAAMIIAVSLSAPNWIAGMYSVIGVLLGGAASLLFLKVFKRREMWTKITLVDQLSTEMGYNSMKESYSGLVGLTGKALTDMRPSGTIKVDGEDYSALSNGKWIYKDEQVKVMAVDGTKILVKKLNEE